MTDEQEIPFLDKDGLQEALDGSYYTIRGAGQDLAEWTTGYTGLLVEQEIGTPEKWFRTNGATVNEFAASKKGGLIHEQDRFQGDLSILMFPLTGLAVGKLATFRIRMQDVWFDDILLNMRPRA